MIKAKDLIKKQKDKEEQRKKTFDKIYTIIEKKICIASNANYYHIWYQVPEFLVGLPVYSHTDCKKYLQDKLTTNGFQVDLFDPNILFIKWFPN
jgi:hypothetical protein